MSINGVNAAGLALRVALVAVLFTVLPARLWYAGVALFAGAAVCLAGYIGLWRRLTPQLHVRVSTFDSSRMRVMLSMSGWLVVNMTGAMLLGRADLIVVNAYYGAAVTGGYAAVAQLAILIEYLVNSAAVVVRPVILAKYALGDFLGLQTVAAQSVRMLGMGLALPVGLLCGFGRPLLTVWLGPSYAYLGSLLALLVFHQALILSVRPLLHVQNAYDRVKWPGIVHPDLGCGGARIGHRVCAMGSVGLPGGGAGDRHCLDGQERVVHADLHGQHHGTSLVDILPVPGAQHRRNDLRGRRRVRPRAVPHAGQRAHLGRVRAGCVHCLCGVRVVDPHEQRRPAIDPGCGRA